MKKIGSLTAVLLFCFLCAGCISLFQTTSKNTGGQQTGGVQPPPASGPLDKANQAYRSGSYQEAAGLYKSYLSQNPNPQNLEEILAAYSYSADRAGFKGEAMETYARLTQTFPQGQYSPEARVRLAELYLGEGQTPQAAAAAQSALGNENDAGRQNRLRLVLAQAFWSQNKFKEAAENFLAVYQKSDGPLKQAAKEGFEATLPHLDVMTVSAYQHQYGQNFPGPEATYVLTWQAAKMNDIPAAKAQAEYFDHYFKSHPLSAQVALIISALNSGTALPNMTLGQSYLPKALEGGGGAPEISALGAAAGAAAAGPASFGGVAGEVNIAAVLPLSDSSSGRYAGDVLKGLQLAVKQAPSNLRVGVLALDTKGQADLAANMVAQAAGRNDVLAIVGPLTSRESLAAAQTAKSQGVPMIAISQNAEITSVGGEVFRLFLTPKHQAEAVARYAVKGKGHQALGVLYPSDAYGQSMRRYFEDEARKNGGQVVQAETYDPKAKNWQEAVNRLTGGSAGRKVTASYQAKTAYTSLYIPAPAGEVTQILPQMAFHDVTRMEYLGTPLWLNKDLLANAGRYLQNSVIPVPISDLSGRSETRRFIEEWNQAYGGPPDQFGAYGYDAGLALVNALAKGAGKRQEVASALKGARVNGATGDFSFAANGEYVINPTLLTIQGQAFKLLREPGDW